jgi:hypothetical protein
VASKAYAYYKQSISDCSLARDDKRARAKPPPAVVVQPGSPRCHSGTASAAGAATGGVILAVQTIVCRVCSVHKHIPYLQLFLCCSGCAQQNLLSSLLCSAGLYRVAAAAMHASHTSYCCGSRFQCIRSLWVTRPAHPQQPCKTRQPHMKCTACCTALCSSCTVQQVAAATIHGKPGTLTRQANCPSAQTMQ